VFPHHKILYITPGLPVGGAEKFLASLCNAFARDGRCTQTLFSVSDHNPMREEFSPSVHIEVCPRSSKWDLAPLKKIRAFIRHENPDTIFCINFFSYFIYRISAAGLGWKGKCVISYHSTIHLNRKEHWLHKLYFAMLGPGDRIITVSENQADYTIRHYHLPREKFITIHNGIDTDFWKLAADKQDRLQVRTANGIPAEAQVIILTAGFRQEKNHAGAMRALEILHAQYGKKAYLLLVGGGPLDEAVRAQAKHSPVADYIRFAGIQKNVRPYYHAADLFTLTSTAVETFSIAALEAMACGLPVVLTDIGGAGEMVEAGVNGYLCETTDQDIAHAWDKALGQDFNAAGIHNWIRDRYSLGAMTDAYARLLFDNQQYENGIIAHAHR
jgi:glycosyltransferase involved in cell wall biosynthesis